MRKLTNYLVFCLLFISLPFYAQNVIIEGYVFETNNRGYLNVVEIEVLDSSTKAIRAKTSSDMDGKFILELAPNGSYLIRAKKKVFKLAETIISTQGKQAGEKVYVKIEMEREPGYLFDVTMAEKRVGDNPADAITNATIEVYNNTKKQEELVLKNHPPPTFNFTFEQGNHYTILIRKDNFFNKRMEAYVNVEGCILCFDGVGNVKPGISEVLTAGHQMGTLLANVELTPIELNKSIKIENIYYDYNDFKIRKDAALELDKLISVLKNNPAIIVELGSHTDARGKDRYNLKLSQKRAKAAVNYIITKGGIDPTRITGKGYGETALINTCKNGVKCSDQKHQENRRTELKIIGISSDDPYANLSLAEIIEAEEFQKLLEEVQNQEIVKVEAGEELPKEISAQQSTVPNSSEQELPIAENKIVESNTIPKKEKTELPSTKAKNTMNSLESIETNANAETKIAAKKTKNTVPPYAMNHTKTQNPARFKKEQEDMGTIDNPKIIAGSKEYANKRQALLGSSTNGITREVEVTSSTNFRKPKALPRNYEGYRIEFYNTNAELSLSHVIFSRHGNITIEQKKNGNYAYLIGDFKSKRQAKEFLNAVLLKPYPNAKVVKYRRGNRVGG